MAYLGSYSSSDNQKFSKKDRDKIAANKLKKGDFQPGDSRYVENANTSISRRENTGNNNKLTSPASGGSQATSSIPVDQPSQSAGAGFPLVDQSVMQEGAQDPTYWQSVWENIQKAALPGQYGSLVADEAGNPADIGTPPIIGPAGSVPKGLSKTWKLLTGKIKNINQVGKIQDTVVAGQRISNAPLNSRTIAQTESILSKKFTAKALAVGGAWAGAVFLGKWGQAESSEPLSIVINDIRDEAEKTGDFSLLHEAEAARNELLDLSWWEEIGLWSPVSPVIGIPKKIQGAIEAAKVNDQLSADIEQRVVNGESDDEFYARIADQKVAAADLEREKEAAYYAEITRQKAIAAENERVADLAYWDSVLAKQEESLKRKKDIETDYWSKYYKALAEYNEKKLSLSTKSSYSYEPPSKLNFGLL